jgi:hypothetical protein
MCWKAMRAKHQSAKRTNENSPAIYRWESDGQPAAIPEADGRTFIETSVARYAGFEFFGGPCPSTKVPGYFQASA